MNLASHTQAAVHAGLTPPVRLKPLVTALVGAGGAVLDPRERAGLHPLVLPLIRETKGGTVGLLRWPTPLPNMPAQVVRFHPSQPHTLELVAVSADAHLHRHLAIRDAQGEPLSEALLASVNEPESLYEAGQAAASGLPLKAYLLVRVGETHAFFEELVEAHLAKGDTTAAKVTADRACQQDHGWGRPWVYRAHLLERLNHPDEARDTARLALGEPVWTYGAPFAPLAQLAGWSTVSSAPYRELATTASKPPADRAAHLMDAVSIEGGDWDGARANLAALYREAGLDQVAEFVAG